MSLQTNDIITEQVARMLSLTPLQVHEIISFQFRTIKEAASSANSIEISGIGKLKIRPNVLEKRLQNLDFWEANIDSGKSEDKKGIRKESIIKERASLLKRKAKLIKNENQA